ncbi:MAG: chromate resistance protein ChrB domain-containing protein [Pseudomonadota bacterium]
MVQKQVIGLIASFICVLLLSGAYASENTQQPQAFATWDIFEADKCASIWLIKRFISPSTDIHFYSRDESPPQGILFDTPEAKFRRYHNKSTYETLLEHYKLNDSTLTYIGRIIHDIEVNTWERKVMDETRKIEAEVFEFLDDRQPEKTVNACVGYFDTLFTSLRQAIK